jgi:hypothetical protein
MTIQESVVELQGLWAILFPKTVAMPTPQNFAVWLARYGNLADDNRIIKDSLAQASVKYQNMKKDGVIMDSIWVLRYAGSCMNFAFFGPTKRKEINRQ